MSKRYAIVVGDPTTAGGQAVEGDSGFMIQCVDGAMRALARVGDAVLCDQCGPTRIAQGMALFLSGGAPAAYDGCALACGHQMISTLQRGMSVEIQDGVGSSASSSSQWNRARDRSTADSPAAFDEAFVLISMHTGKPLANRRYKVHRNGSVETGMTDSSGSTHVIKSHMTEELVIKIQEEGP